MKLSKCSSKIFRPRIFRFMMGVVLLVSLVPGLSTAAQPEVLEGEAENVELVGHIEGSFTAVAVEGDYVYAGKQEGTEESPLYILVILDISNPVDPKKRGQIELTSSIEDLVVSGGYVYVANWYRGLRIIDVSDPDHPNEVGHYDPPGRTLVVALNGDYAYMLSWLRGLRVIDVSDPYNPEEVGSRGLAAEYNRDMAHSGDYVYVATSSNGLQMIDVTNPNQPLVVGTYYHSYRWGARAVAVRGEYAYVSPDRRVSELQVVDVSDPTSPSMVGCYDDTPGEWGINAVALSTDYAYVTHDWYIGLYVIDVSDPTSPGMVGRYETTRSLDLALGGGYVYIAGREEGLFILRYMELTPTPTPTEEPGELYHLSLPLICR